MNPLTEVTSVIQNINIACRLSKLFGSQGRLACLALPDRIFSKIRRTQKILMFVLSVITLVVTLGLSPESCKAGPITVEYSETPDKFDLLITGVRFNLPIQMHTITRSGSWMVTVEIIESAIRPFNDHLSITATARHIVGPHLEGPNPVGFLINFDVVASDFAPGNHTRPLFPPACGSLAHGEHLDRFCASLSFTTVFLNTITDYTFNLTGEHVVPEPATLILLGTGLIGIGAAARAGAAKSTRADLDRIK